MRARPLIPPFMFATGIENSNPALAGGTVRVDEMEKCGHYTHWRTDFDCVHALGLHVLRYGPPLYRSSPRLLDSNPRLVTRPREART